MAFGNQKKLRTDWKPKFKPSQQQEQIVDRVVNDRKNVTIVAFAGAGKTSTFELVVDAFQRKYPHDLVTSVQYNRNMADEAKKRYPKGGRTDISTVHSLAARATIHGKSIVDLYMGRVVRNAGLKNIRDRISTDLSRDVERIRHWFPNEYTAVTAITATLQKFMQSNDTLVNENHASREHAIYIKDMVNLESALEFRKEVAKAAQNLWIKMETDKSFPITDDVYLKAWEMHGDHGGRPLVLIDETQDASPVIVSVAQKMQQEGSQLVLVGDPHQSLYGWRGAIDAMNAFPDFEKLYLTESWRFGQTIADHAQLFLDVGGEKNKLIGMNPDKGRFEDQLHATHGRPFDPEAILCRTNGGVIFETLDAIKNGQKPYIIGNAGSSHGGAADAVLILKAIGGLHDGDSRRIRHPEISLFENWQDLTDFADTDDGKQLSMFVKLVQEHKQHGTFSKIIDALEHGTAKDRASASVIISTYHKAKGDEYNTVALGQDAETVNLVNEHKYIDNEGYDDVAFSLNNENRMLLYVVETRCKKAIDTRGFHQIYENQVKNLRTNPLTQEIKARIKEQRKNGQISESASVRQNFSKVINKEFKKEDY